MRRQGGLLSPGSWLTHLPAPLVGARVYEDIWHGAWHSAGSPSLWGPAAVLLPTVLAILASLLLETSPCDSLPVLPESFSLQPLPPVMVCGLPEAMSWSVSPTSEFCIQATQGLAGGGYGVCMCCWLSGGGRDMCMGEDTRRALSQAPEGHPRRSHGQPRILEETLEGETGSSSTPLKWLYLCCPVSSG